jgi:hypothetical protein
MFITKKHLDRRTFLRGMGATVALPVLDAMIPAHTALAATAARPVPRLLFVYVPHGAIMNEWASSGTGGAVELGRILEPLAAFGNQLTVVSGIENRHAYGPVHAITPGTWLSGTSPRPGTVPTHGMSADQVAADQFGRDTWLPSIEVATERPRKIPAGAWEGEYSDSLGTTISFRGRSTPLPMEFSPRKVFSRMFAQNCAGEEGGVRTPASILDLVAADTVALRHHLGSADRAVLSGYLDTVRDVERRAAEIDTGVESGSEAPSDVSLSFEARANLMFDLIGLALRADITRVASFMLAAETSQVTYDSIGVSDPFHSLSHHQHDREKIERLVRIQAYHTRLFARFVETLANIPDGGGLLLDRSLILYGSNMSDSHAHDHFPLPLVLVGGACRTLGAQYVRCPDRTPMSNLLLAMLHRTGVMVESIGDSSGACALV